MIPVPRILVKWLEEHTLPQLPNVTVVPAAMGRDWGAPDG